MKLLGFISFIIAFIDLFSENCMPVSRAAMTYFHCTELNQNIFTQEGLPGVSKVFLHSDNVCQVHYRGNSIVISTMQSRHIAELRNSANFKSSHYRLGNYDVLITAPSQQGCAHVIINHIQLITVSSPYCDLTRKTVSIIIHILR